MSFITNILSSLQSKDGSGSSVVGIDVGSASMKVVEERRKVVTLVTYSEVQQFHMLKTTWGFSHA